MFQYLRIIWMLHTYRHSFIFGLICFHHSSALMFSGGSEGRMASSTRNDVSATLYHLLGWCRAVSCCRTHVCTFFILLFQHAAHCEWMRTAHRRTMHMARMCNNVETNSSVMKLKPNNRQNNNNNNKKVSTMYASGSAAYIPRRTSTGIEQQQKIRFFQWNGRKET